MNIDIITVGGAEVPRYEHDGDAGFDLTNNDDEFILYSGKSCRVRTGLKFALPRGYVLKVCPRSGLAAKEGITVLNSPGIVDSNYRGEICVILYNATSGDYMVRKHERIAQGVIQAVETCKFNRVKVLPETDRGEQGFGSSGTI